MHGVGRTWSTFGFAVSVATAIAFAPDREFWSGANPVKDSERWFPKQPPQARLTPLPDGRVRMELAEGALYVRLAPDALLAWDEKGDLLARVSDVDGRATLVGGRLSEP